MKTKGLRLALAMSMAALLAVGCEPETVTPVDATGAVYGNVNDQSVNLVGTLWKSVFYLDNTLARQYGYDIVTKATSYMYFVNDSVTRWTFRTEMWGGDQYYDSISRDLLEFAYEFNGVDFGYVYRTGDEGERQQFVVESPDCIILGAPQFVSDTFYRVDDYEF